MFLHLRIPADDGFHGIWLPWFLVYPILLALMLIALPLVILLAIIALPFGRTRMLFLSGVLIWRVLFNMRGLIVDIETGPRKLLISFV
jgi:hypothetical protein